MASLPARSGDCSAQLGHGVRQPSLAQEPQIGLQYEIFNNGNMSSTQVK